MHYLSDRMVAKNYNAVGKAKQTFNNLPPERQKQIIDTAIKEFIQNDYRNASLSNIIKKLELAKGSFYRYFNSKKELYLFLVNHVTEGRFDEIEELTTHLPENLEDLIVANFKNKILFDKKYPVHSGFIYQVMRELGTPELEGIALNIKQQILSATKKILLNYQARKTIRQHINIDTAAWVTVQVQFGIYEYLRLHFDVNFLKNIEQGIPVFGDFEDELMKIVTEFADILSNGLSKKPR